MADKTEREKVIIYHKNPIQFDIIQHARHIYVYPVYGRKLTSVHTKVCYCCCFFVSLRKSLRSLQRKVGVMMMWRKIAWVLHPVSSLVDTVAVLISVHYCFIIIIIIYFQFHSIGTELWYCGFCSAAASSETSVCTHAHIRRFFYCSWGWDVLSGIFPGVALDSGRPGFVSATCWSQIQHSHCSATTGTTEVTDVVIVSDSREYRDFCRTSWFATRPRSKCYVPMIHWLQLWFNFSLMPLNFPSKWLSVRTVTANDGRTVFDLKSNHRQTNHTCNHHDITLCCL